MAIGILYESREWSTYQLKKEIELLHEEAFLIDLEEGFKEEKILPCDLLVNRIFASAYLRGHKRSIRRMTRIIKLAKAQNIPMINPYDAHKYEMDKNLCAGVLKEKGFSVPEVYGVFYPKDIEKITVKKYPCILKPNCGGRAEETYIVENESVLLGSMKLAPNIEFILEEYIAPAYGFVTRLEIINGECRFIAKRKAINNKHTSNHLDATYIPYPQCPEHLKKAALDVMKTLEILCGSVVMIETKGGYAIINVNAVSNSSETMVKAYDFDLIKETAKFIVDYKRNSTAKK